MFIFDLN